MSGDRHHPGPGSTTPRYSGTFLLALREAAAQLGWSIGGWRGHLVPHGRLTTGIDREPLRPRRDQLPRAEGAEQLRFAPYPRAGAAGEPCHKLAAPARRQREAAGGERDVEFRGRRPLISLEQRQQRVERCVQPRRRPFAGSKERLWPGISRQAAGRGTAVRGVRDPAIAVAAEVPPTLRSCCGGARTGSGAGTSSPAHSATSGGAWTANSAVKLNGSSSELGRS